MFVESRCETRLLGSANQQNMKPYMPLKIYHNPGCVTDSERFMQFKVRLS